MARNVVVFSGARLIIASITSICSGVSSESGMMVEVAEESVEFPKFAKVLPELFALLEGVDDLSGSKSMSLKTLCTTSLAMVGWAEAPKARLYSVLARRKTASCWRHGVNKHQQRNAINSRLGPAD